MMNKIVIWLGILSLELLSYEQPINLFFQLNNGCGLQASNSQVTICDQLPYYFWVEPSYLFCLMVGESCLALVSNSMV